MAGCGLQRKTYEAQTVPSATMAISSTRPNALPALQRALVVGGGGREYGLGLGPLPGPGHDLDHSRQRRR